jgi:hypothetical protein
MLLVVVAISYFLFELSLALEVLYDYDCSLIVMVIWRRFLHRNFGLDEISASSLRSDFDNTRIYASNALD